MPFFRQKLNELLAAKRLEDSGHSLRKFAENLAIDPGVLSRLLTGKRKPSVKTAKRLLRRLHLDQNEEKRFLESVIDEQVRGWLTEH